MKNSIVQIFIRADSNETKMQKTYDVDGSGSL